MSDGWTRQAPGIWTHTDGSRLERERHRTWWLDEGPTDPIRGPWPSLDAALEAIGKGETQQTGARR